jgi:transposase
LSRNIYLVLSSGRSTSEARHVTEAVRDSPPRQNSAKELIEHLRAKAVIADKGYDADTFVQTIRATRAKVVIPPRSNRKTKRRYSRALYRTRNLVGRFFGRIKHCRRVSTRYDKLADSYLVFASLASAFGPIVNVNTV